MSITVTTSWIFNRLCDEPQRLEQELIERVRSIHRESLTLDDIKIIHESYNRVLEARAVEAELRLANHPEFHIVNNIPKVMSATVINEVRK